MPDCLLYNSWLRDGESWSPDDVASYFGDLIRANREGLKALSSWSSELQVTIESGELLLVLQEINPDFVCASVFDRAAPLGMVRLHVKRLVAQIRESLPEFEIEKRPRAVRLVEFLKRYAPDPHAVLLRVALRTGIRLEVLERPETLEDDQVSLLEAASKQILGLEELNA